MRNILASVVKVLVSGGAWLFVVCSLLTLVITLCTGALLPDSVSRVWAAGVDSESGETFVSIIQIPIPGEELSFAEAHGNAQALNEAIALTYRGRAGMWFAACQAALVATFMIMSTRRRDVYRRLGHLGLSAWAALWLGNVLWMMITASVSATQIAFGVMLFLFVCTMLRAYWNWECPS